MSRGSEAGRKSWAAVVTSVFFAVGPGVVAGVIPRRLTRWQVRRPVPGGLPVRVVGGLLVAGGAVGMAHCFVRFVVEGLGTPLPVAPTRHLVVGGVYRHVRNPMYLAGEAAIVGQGLLLGQPVLLFYGMSLAVPVVAFVRSYEEPTMWKTFGAEYDDYRCNVPAWWPRLRAWRAGT